MSSPIFIIKAPFIRAGLFFEVNSDNMKYVPLPMATSPDYLFALIHFLLFEKPISFLNFIFFIFLDKNEAKNQERKMLPGTLDFF